MFFDFVLNGAILLIAVFHWQATIMGPVCKLLCISISRNSLT